ncbi:hypothetical protein Aspvir_000562 [Aspergillus viridinutans]|uniref:Uncharacterized protein n=1 Tax=Aspergillus viridinutans TaxID=75553 RepID=A0A9P3BRU4_ASPVI|nr:uncharacterized protein Aspvir_000562 [Aspergillus viridinutans]GIJ98445.1 hypothetical protein Aspvir_000562 [Aspergillus viridinutans]
MSKQGRYFPFSKDHIWCRVFLGSSSSSSNHPSASPYCYGTSQTADREADLPLGAESKVSVTDDSDDNEHFRVGSKLGLVGRFHKHICDAVAKALSVTELARLAFGDFQATAHTDSDVPDVVLLALSRLDVLAVGVLKTFWTVELEKYPVNDGAANMAIMQPHFGIMNPYSRLLTC